jgi:hypothetical protein
MTVDEKRAHRNALRAEYGELYDRVSAILFEEDPVGINFEVNTDEYELEVDTILPRLKSCHTVEDVRALVHEEMVRCFDSASAGPPERYATIAARIWALIGGASRP